MPTRLQLRPGQGDRLEIPDENHAIERYNLCVLNVMLRCFAEVQYRLRKRIYGCIRKICEPQFPRLYPAAKPT